MRHLLLAVLLSTLALGVAHPAGAAPYADPFGPLSDTDQVRVDRNEIVVQVERTDVPLKHFRAIGLVKAPARAVYGVMTSFEQYPDIFKIQSSRIQSHHDQTLMVRAGMEFPWPIGERWVMNETVLSPDSLSFVYHRREGNIQEYDGTIQVVSRGARLAELRYAAKADPGLPFMPTWLLNQFQSSLLPSSIQRVRDYLQAHPTLAN